MRKILFVVTEDWYFYSHRFALAKLIQKSGYQVVLATRLSKYEKEINDAGIKTIPLKKMKRSSLNFIREIGAFFELLRIYISERPDLVHQVSLKPVIYGSIAALFLKIPAIVNALGGLGYVFTSSRNLAVILRPFLVFILKIVLARSNSITILQNSDDAKLLITKTGLKNQNYKIIPGVGYEPKKIKYTDIKKTEPVVLLASRMLWDKGIKEFVEAARELKLEGANARFILIGAPDPENPSSISKNILKSWSEEGCIEWWGYREDLPDIIAQARIVCLPSFREGMPKVLIEAMAAARPIITTNAPGCRDLVHLNKNGLLILPRDSSSLKEALRLLLGDIVLSKKMGLEGRKLAIKEYSLKKIFKSTISIYDELLSK